MSSTLIVYFVTIGVLLPGIVIFSLSLCALASFDSNLFALCCFFAFLPFAFLILRFCYHAPTKTISLQVGRKLADKTKDEIMTKVLWVFAGLDVKLVQVAYEVVRITFASPEHFRAVKSFLGKHLFSLWCSILGGGTPVTPRTFFDFPFEEDDRSLEVAFETYGAVKSVKKQTFLSNQNILSGTRLVTPLSDGGSIFVSFVVSWSTPCFQSLCRSGPQIAKLPQHGQVQIVRENRALFSELYF